MSCKNLQANNNNKMPKRTIKTHRNIYEGDQSLPRNLIDSYSTLYLAAFPHYTDAAL